MTTNCIVCNQPTHKQCGRCNDVSFCSKKCLESKWTYHKLTCSPKVIIKKSTERSGLGVFAKQSFAVGEEIFREKPLIRIPQHLFSLNIEHNIQLCNKLINEHPPEIRDCIMNFTDVRTDLSTQENVPTTYGIFLTNSVPLGNTSNGESPDGGIFARTCRINHSCKPNARYIWRPDLKRELVIAMRPIAIDEEITVTYNEKYLPQKKRQERLQQSFHFTCECSLCRSPSEERDNRLSKIQDLIDNILEFDDSNPKKNLIMAEQVIKLLHKEGFNTPMDLYPRYYEAFLIANGLGYIHKAIQHLRSAWKYSKLSKGDTSPDAVKLERLIKQFE